MAGSVRVKTTDVNTDELLQESEKAALVNYSTEYAKYVEFPTSYAGTQPPFQPLYEWVQRKWPDLSAGLKEAGLPASTREQQQRNVAWIVVKAIARNGTRGVYFGRRGLDTAAKAAPAIAAQYEGSGDPNAPEKIVQEVATVGFNRGQAIIADEASDTGNLLQSGSIEILDDPSELGEGGRS